MKFYVVIYKVASSKKKKKNHCYNSPFDYWETEAQKMRSKKTTAVNFVLNSILVPRKLYSSLLERPLNI